MTKYSKTQAIEILKELVKQGHLEVDWKIEDSKANRTTARRMWIWNGRGTAVIKDDN